MRRSGYFMTSTYWYFILYVCQIIFKACNIKRLVGNDAYFLNTPKSIFLCTVCVNTMSTFTCVYTSPRLFCLSFRHAFFIPFHLSHSNASPLQSPCRLAKFSYKFHAIAILKNYFEFS
ncbi:hypothetical protein F4703DRAFT_1539819 [Phycomyces blakesleeanus]